MLNLPPFWTAKGKEPKSPRHIPRSDSAPTPTGTPRVLPSEYRRRRNQERSTRSGVLSVGHLYLVCCHSWCATPAELRLLLKRYHRQHPDAIRSERRHTLITRTPPHTPLVRNPQSPKLRLVEPWHDTSSGLTFNSLSHLQSRWDIGRHGGRLNLSFLRV